MPILATKLFIPPPRPRVVPRPRLIERLNEGLRQNQGFGSKLILISASAGFGKTTLVSEWIAACGRPAAWLSLEEGDGEPTRFVAYLIAALQTIADRLSPAGAIGEGVLVALQSPQPQPIEGLLTALLNEIAAFTDDFVLVLDDYHAVDTRPVGAFKSVDDALAFLVEHQPPQMHLVIATREDPQLPLARLRARGQLTELRTADLRFTPAEAAEFLNQVMGLALSPEDISALETRTEGWIAGLQLAALALHGTLSIEGRENASAFINSFTGSHHFVLDYLMEEVLQRQPESVQTFLLRTSILDRLCGPLCDAVLQGDDLRQETEGRETLGQATAGQKTLEYLERANLFLVPLDNERRWYRYHHLFAELLRQRVQQQAQTDVAQLHIRASQWYEDHSLVLEAFHHAAAAHDIDRAERLIEEKEMPLQYRDAVAAILNWLESLTKAELDARPTLWVRRGTLRLVAGQRTGVEENLRAAEAAMAASGDLQNDKTRNLIGQIAAARATLALTHYDAETIIAQSRRALEYLRPDNMAFRMTVLWTQGFAHYLLGDRAAAARAYSEALLISQESKDIFFTILAASGLGVVQELENALYPAEKTYRNALQLFGDHPQPNACEVHLGLARIYYEWNDLDAAQYHAQQSLQLAQMYDRVIDRFIISEVFLARLKLAQGDVAGAAAILSEADQSVRQQNFLLRAPEVAAAQVIVLVKQGNLTAAENLAQMHALPLGLARIHLARGDPSAALTVLEKYRQQMEAKGWQDEQLRIMILQAVAHHLQGEKDRAMQVLVDALTLAEPGGFIRIFIDEGLPVKELLSAAAAQGVMPDYVHKLLAAFAFEAQKLGDKSGLTHNQPLLEPLPHEEAVSLVDALSQRELEVLRLIALGLSNREICNRLFLALDTVKGHNRLIFDKLQVKSRTEAVARARELGLI